MFKKVGGLEILRFFFTAYINFCGEGKSRSTAVFNNRRYVVELLYKNNGVNVSKIDLIDLYYISVETSPNYFLIAIQRFMLIVCDSITGGVFQFLCLYRNNAS